MEEQSDLVNDKKVFKNEDAKWTYSVEIKFLELLQSYGHGNWANIANTLSNCTGAEFSAEEVSKHYYSVYVHGPLGKVIWSLDKRDEQVKWENHATPEDDELLEGPDLDVIQHVPRDFLKEIKYLPHRLEFFKEYESNAESIIEYIAPSNAPHKSKFVKDANLIALDIYRHKLRERARMHDFIRSHKLIEKYYIKSRSQKASRKSSKSEEVDLFIDVLPFAKLMSETDFKTYFEDILTEHRLKKEINNIFSQYSDGSNVSADGQGPSHLDWENLAEDFIDFYNKEHTSQQAEEDFVDFCCKEYNSQKAETTVGDSCVKELEINEEHDESANLDNIKNSAVSSCKLVCQIENDITETDYIKTKTSANDNPHTDDRPQKSLKRRILPHDFEFYQPTSECRKSRKLDFEETAGSDADDAINNEQHCDRNEANPETSKSDEKKVLDCDLPESSVNALVMSQSSSLCSRDDRKSEEKGTNVPHQTMDVESDISCGVSETESTCKAVSIDGSENIEDMGSANSDSESSDSEDDDDESETDSTESDDGNEDGGNTELQKFIPRVGFMDRTYRGSRFGIRGDMFADVIIDSDSDSDSQDEFYKETEDSRITKEKAENDRKARETFRAHLNLKLTLNLLSELYQILFEDDHFEKHNFSPEFGKLLLLGQALLTYEESEVIEEENILPAVYIAYKILLLQADEALQENIPVDFDKLHPKTLSKEVSRKIISLHKQKGWIKSSSFCLPGDESPI